MIIIPPITAPPIYLEEERRRRRREEEEKRRFAVSLDCECECVDEDCECHCTSGGSRVGDFVDRDEKEFVYSEVAERLKSCSDFIRLVREREDVQSALLIQWFAGNYYSNDEARRVYTRIHDPTVDRQLYSEDNEVDLSRGVVYRLRRGYLEVVKRGVELCGAETIEALVRSLR